MHFPITIPLAISVIQIMVRYRSQYQLGEGQEDRYIQRVLFLSLRGSEEYSAGS